MQEKKSSFSKHSAAESLLSQAMLASSFFFDAVQKITRTADTSNRCQWYSFEQNVPCDVVVQL